MPKFLSLLVFVVLIALLPVALKKAAGLNKAKPAFVGNPVFVLNQ